MPLDLGETLLQLDQVAQDLGQTREDREARLTALLEAAQGVDPAEAAEITRTSADRPFLAAQVEDRLVGSCAPPPPPADWSVAAVDGSHIDVDRHLPVSCHLINLGGCVLTYGSRPEASFFSHPQLGAGPSELYLADPRNPAQEEAVTGPLLGLVRTVRELERLAEVAAECPSDTPTLALVDGSLVLWGLSGQGYRPFVRDVIIRDRLIPALERAGLGRAPPGHPGRLRIPAPEHRGGQRCQMLPLSP
jgi:hypothetical protein